VLHVGHAGLGLSGVLGIALQQGGKGADVTLGRGRRLTQWRVPLPEGSTAAAAAQSGKGGGGGGANGVTVMLTGKVLPLA
jgi:hypothetical protein